MTSDSVLTWIEREWGKINPKIKNDKQAIVEDFAIKETPGVKNKGFKRAVEINLDKLKTQAEPYINKTNNKYQKSIESEINNTKTIAQLNQIEIDMEYEKASERLQKSLDAQRRFLEIEQKTEETKKIERREDLIRRYMDRGFTKEQAEDIVGL